MIINLGMATCGRSNDNAIYVKLDDHEKWQWIPMMLVDDSSEVRFRGNHGLLIMNSSLTKEEITDNFIDQ